MRTRIFSIFLIFVLLDEISQLRNFLTKTAFFVGKKFAYSKKMYYLCSEFESNLLRF